jgi:glycosyltransferase involved in cell wall biosynthesis
MRSPLENANSPLSISSICRRADSLTAEAVLAHPPKAVYAYENIASHTFRAARQMGVKTIFELPIAYGRYRNELFREEVELQPAFADTFHKSFADAEWMRREEEGLELADQVIVPSGFVQSTLPASIPTSRCRVVPYGTPPLASGALDRRSKGSKLRVLYVGALTQRKGLSYLLEAIKKVGLSVEFTIIGTKLGTCKPLDEALQKYRWIPTAPHNVILEEMSRHDVLAFPTLLEGQALVVLEAMSRGMAVITTPNSGALDIITPGQDGFIIPIRSSDALAEKLDLLSLDRDLLESISIAAQNRAQECSWDKYRELLASVVEQVIEPVREPNHA